MQPFQIMIPGSLPINQFQYFNDMFYTDVSNPKEIQNIVFSINQQIQQTNYVCTLYYTLPPYNSLEYLGYVNNSKPSDIMSPGFALNPDFENQSTIRFVVKFEVLDATKHQQDIAHHQAEQKYFGKLLAQSLYNSALSYQNDQYPDQDQLILPSNFLEKWLFKFEQKFNADPNFIYKTKE